ncbi:putative secreted protein (Por secretion system target) [Lutibacter sp. Hel_I_33_5]|uniref:PEP/pyruvate-binding domain-containing protein n=1 Tax=Lutibacter sp. Hel_I_33_5 TaxID=1566289 RepID=UPI0011A7B290|nr:PEP/pyruvate-binding domain-containing protein [Lutibacter sp. Hel_I_33_5]TVZ56872.1 putative secreted protein (Por secretion system target) [Lutibacter sp. Hel_I_33_5]
MSDKLKITVYFFIICIFFYFQKTNAQIPIHSVISDVVSDIPLKNVNVRFQNSNVIYKSDSNGYFYLKVDSNEKNQEFKGYLFTDGNTLHSFFNTTFNIYIYDSLGKTLYQKNNASERDNISLNNLKTGSYFIKIFSPKGNYIYRLFLSPDKNHISKLKSNSRNYIQKSDSIIFTKENYFKRKLSLSDDRFYNKRGIKLLRKKYENLYYFEELIDENAFVMVADQPSKTHLSGVESLKAIFDSRKNIMYYMNSKKYKLHYTFSKEQLEYKHSHDQYIKEQYSNNSNRYLFPITINYFKNLNIYTFEFFSSDGANCEDVYRIYNKISESSYLKDNLYFYTTNTSWENCKEIPIIGANELFEGQNYQALNIAEGYGYLKKIDVKDISSVNLQKHNIVLTNGIPIDIPVISGIITTEFQTHLSHINVLSYNRGTPNMTLRDGYKDKTLNDLNGKLVYLKVDTDSFQIRKATIEEATAFWNKNEPKNIITLDKDTQNYGIIDLENVSIKDVNKIGGKAANFAEILKAFKREGKTAPVPENYFAIPFYYYEEHLKENGIDTYIDTILNQSEFKTNTEFRKSMLDKIRDSIKNSPLNQKLLSNVLNKMTSDSRFTSYRFRSSTNAEDLEGFNGAGLYSSSSGKLNHDRKTPTRAIKKVWASLWNFRAFEERDYFKINHLSTAMGILVHRSFPDEDANGVVITRNIFNRNHAFVVNVQFKEISVVDADPGIIPDQVIIYTFSSNNNKYTLEYNTFSNVITDTSNHVMSDEELYKLGDYLTIINTYFYSRVYNCNCDYIDFGLDIEFKVDSTIENRYLYIKQARPY